MTGVSEASKLSDLRAADAGSTFDLPYGASSAENPQTVSSVYHVSMAAATGSTLMKQNVVNATSSTYWMGRKVAYVIVTEPGWTVARAKQPPIRVAAIAETRNAERRSRRGSNPSRLPR